MKKDYENIEEKLIPYLEGVLNPKERREVDEAINSDGNLAREMSELREVILELRQGFANGMKPPQEELSVDEVVELGANIGTVDSLPGTSQQKARLFCSDDALEEYSLLRALQEEMARTTLDRENVPEMPESILKEFRALPVASGTRKVLPFNKSTLSPIPLWKRASSLLDRIDPKPLMASAAALMMLSLGVHLYNRPAGPASGAEAPEIGYNFSGEKQTAGDKGVAAPSATPSVAARENTGVAVFTSDDRGLLKEQAEKLLANKVRYTVTKDRILVAEKDIEEARGILWADADGKAVAMAKEGKAEKRMAQSGGQASAAGGASPAPAPDEYPARVVAGSSGGGRGASAVPVVNDDAMAAYAADPGDVTLYNAPSRQSAPPKPTPPVPSRQAGEIPAYSRPATKVSRDPGAELEQGIGSSYSSSKAKAPAAGYAETSAAKPPSPSDVDLSYSSGSVGEDSPSGGVPEPTVVETRSKASESPVMSAQRRQRLRDLAVGPEGEGGEKKDEDSKGNRNERSGSAGDVPPPPPVASQVQTTITMDRARVAAAPPASPASAPVANVITGGTAASQPREDAEDDLADGRLARMESSRQAVAQRNGVELSFEAKGGKVSVYVRPKKTLTKAELDALRKTLRKELGLSDSDTIIFR